MDYDFEALQELILDLMDEISGHMTAEAYAEFQDTETYKNLFRFVHGLKEAGGE